jgi:hypothetical protein
VTELVALRALALVAAPGMLLVLPPPDWHHPGALVALLIAIVPPLIGARSSLAVFRAVRAGSAAMTLWRATPLGEVFRVLLALTVWSASLGTLDGYPTAWPVALLATLGTCAVVWDVRAIHLDGGRGAVSLDGLFARRLPLGAVTLVAAEIRLAIAPHRQTQCWLFELRSERMAPLLLGWTESREVALRFISDVGALTGVRAALRRDGDVETSTASERRSGDPRPAARSRITP